MKLCLLAVLWACCLAGGPRARAAGTEVVFQLDDGDRVVFLGDTFMEREARDGYLEARLTARFAGRRVIFRNLGWSADTVLGESRAGFDAPEKGFDRLKEHLTAVKPTVVFLSHGMAASFGGEKGIPQFQADMKTLIETIRAICGDTVRLVILGPIHHENLGAPLPDGQTHNAQLRKYSDALREVAQAQKAAFVPLFDLTPKYENSPQFGPLTDNGIHLTPYGYWRVAEIVEGQLGLTPPVWKVRLEGGNQSEGVATHDVSVRRTGFSFVGRDEFILPPPAPVAPEGAAGIGLISTHRLDEGNYTLLIDGEPSAIHSSVEWMAGRAFYRGGGFAQVEKLRAAIIKKNQLFFYRWRPQNETYLLGFRKHEQGQNAREIPLFDPLVAEQEEAIFQLSKLAERSYELRPATAEDRTKLAANSKTAPKAAASFTPTFEQPDPSFELDPEVEVTLFAENPDLAKPIQINFDPQGRLWVASSSVYPQIQPGQTANDKILILEDTDGDGRVDKSTVFAEGLLIPTGVEPGDGGAYVANSTELLHFKDTDGDGHADVKRVMLSSFGTEDTHHILHTLRWGHDGQLYMNQSIYIHSHVETPHGVVRLNSGGIWNFRPSTMELGIHAKGWVNSWGHHFDRFGQSFVTDGAGGEGINWAVPQAMYTTYAGARRILGSVSPGSYPKFCGIEVIESRQFPDAWQGTVITCDFRAHRVVRFAVNELEAGYVTKELPDVMRTTNVTFRPIDVKLGPDGALYIADWSNPIIQHGEVDFRDPRRDHEHGRIWRVAAKGRPALPRKDYTRLATKELLDELLSPNNYNRQRARRVLTEKGPSIEKDLAAWSKARSTDQAHLEALWMYQAVDIVNAELLQSSLHAGDGRIRAAATRVLSFWRDRIPNPLDLLAERVNDEHPRSRVEAMRAAAKIPSAKSAELVLGTLDKPQDRFTDYAAWLSINDLAEPWLAAIKAGDWKIEGREKQLAFGLKALPPQQASSALATVLPKNHLPKDGSGPWIDLIAQAGTGAELRRLYDDTFSQGFDEATTLRSMDALLEAARSRGAKPSGDLIDLGPALNAANAQVKLRAVRLAGAWKSAEASELLLGLAAESNGALEVRRAAVQSVREIGGAPAVEGLAKLADGGNDAPLRQEAVLALAALDSGKAVGPAIEVLSGFKDEGAALTFWRGLLSNKGAAAVFAQGLPKSGLPSTAAKAGLRAAREGGRNEPALILALARNLDTEGDAQNLSPEELKALMSKITQTGDPARGERIYRRAELGCVGCHAVAGVGGKVGPDMTSIGASAPLDYLVESVQFPNRKVKEGYHSLQIETKDGQELSGVLVRENQDQLVVRDAANQEVAVASANIAKRVVGGSLMPVGLIDGLSQEEQIDLFRFLSELGKPGPFDGSKGSVARVWKLLPQTIDIAQFGDEKVVAQTMMEKGWLTAATLVDGRLLKDDLMAALKSIQWRNPEAVYAGTQLQVPRDGITRLQFDNRGDAPVWIDGVLLKAGAEGQTELKAGTHRIVTRLPGRAFPEFIRLSTSDGTFLTN